VDIDRYIARNQPTWDRLEYLVGRARTGIGRLGPTEVEELVQLYQRTSAHLSYVRTYLREPTLTARLTRLVATANGVIYGKRARTLRVFTRFYTSTFPGAVYHCRRFVLVAALVFFVPAIVLGVWLSNDDAALDASASKRVRQEYVHELFEQYYSDRPSIQFFTEVTVNNIGVSFNVFALGAISGGAGAIALLAFNGAPLGIIGSWMISEGDFWRFLGFIVPHGAMELTAIIIAGGAGLAVGWSAVAPGDRTRADALRDEAQRSITIILGLMTMFFGAGVVEGFITGSGMPVGLRVGIGVLLLIAYSGYLVVQGRAAAAQGITGLLTERERTWADEPDRWTRPGDLTPAGTGELRTARRTQE
jgi:uncharacterized membrane protein SpoIIM required for sporulation